MDELAAEAGITKPILYSHFGDKAGLATALAERAAAELNQAIAVELARDRDPGEVVSSTIEAFCTFIETEPELYRFLVQMAMHQSSQPGRSSPRLVNDISDVIAKALGNSLRQVGADSAAVELWAFTIVGMAFAGAGWWLERQSMSKQELVGYLSQLLWSGLSGVGLGRQGSTIWLEPGTVTPLRDRSAAGGD
jgi:AcrR family transcriptional regulator